MMFRYDLKSLTEAVEGDVLGWIGIKNAASDVFPAKVAVMIANAYGRDMHAATAFLRTILPGWGWRGGTCYLSDDAFVFPDFACPKHGAALKESVPETIEGQEWADFTDIDQRPAGNPARALLRATLRAYIHTRENPK